MRTIDIPDIACLHLDQQGLQPPRLSQYPLYPILPKHRFQRNPSFGAFPLSESTFYSFGLIPHSQYRLQKKLQRIDCRSFVCPIIDEKLALIIIRNNREPLHEQMHLRGDVRHVVWCIFERLPEVVDFVDAVADLDSERNYADDTRSTTKGLHDFLILMNY